MDPTSSLATDHPATMSTYLPASLEECRINGLPNTAFYIPNFINQDEEQAILEKVGSCLAADVAKVRIKLTLCCCYSDCLSSQAQVETTYTSKATNLAFGPGAE